MSLESYLILAHSDTALLALISALSFIRLNQRAHEVKLIGLIGLVGFLSNGLSFLFAKYRLTPFINIPGSIYDLLLVVFTSMLYNNQTSRKYKTFFTVVPCLYVLLGLLNLIFFQKEEIASYTKLGGSMIIIIYAVVYFYRLMIDLPTHELHRLPMFWFNSAFLIFNAGTVFLFAFTAYLIHVLKDDMLIYYSFHNMLSIIHHLIIVVGLLFYYRSTSEIIAV
jgi:hypothetical protein